MSTPDQLAEITGQDPGEIGTNLAKAEADGTVLGRKGKYMISPAGREALEAACPAAFAETRSSPAVAEAIEAFETVETMGCGAAGMDGNACVVTILSTGDAARPG